MYLQGEMSLDKCTVKEAVRLGLGSVPMRMYPILLIPFTVTIMFPQTHKEIKQILKKLEDEYMFLDQNHTDGQKIILRIY